MLKPNSDCLHSRRIIMEARMDDLERRLKAMEANNAENFKKLFALLSAKVSQSENKIASDSGEGGSNFCLSVGKFSSEDPVGWITRAEVYFCVQHTLPELRVNLAKLCIDGDVLKALIEKEGEGKVITWEGLKHWLLKRHGGRSE